MEKFVLRNKAGQPVFIQQEGNLTQPTVRLTPTTLMPSRDSRVGMLASMAGISMGMVVEQCVAYAISNMAAIDEEVQQ